MCKMSKTSNIITKIKQLFAEEEHIGDYNAATGEIIRVMGNLSVGTKVAEMAAEKEAPLPDGNYLLDGGKSITVVSGEISEINEYDAGNKPNPVEMEETKMECEPNPEEMEDAYGKEISTKLEDGTEVKILSKGEALSVGDSVLVKDASGEFVKAPEGAHKLIEGLTIYTDSEGFINELETAETDSEEDDSEEMKTMFEAVTSMKSIVDELRSTINDLKTENNELKERFNKFSAEPSAKTITKKTETLSKTTKKEDKLKFFGQR